MFITPHLILEKGLGKKEKKLNEKKNLKQFDCWHSEKNKNKNTKG